MPPVAVAVQCRACASHIQTIKAPATQTCLQGKPSDCCWLQCSERRPPAKTVAHLVADFAPQRERLQHVVILQAGHGRRDKA